MTQLKEGEEEREWEREGKGGGGGGGKTKVQMISEFFDRFCNTLSLE